MSETVVVPTLAQIDARIEAMAGEYEWRGDNGDHTPTEGERCMLIDFSHGIMADEELVAMLRAHFAAAPSPASNPGFASMNGKHQWWGAGEPDCPKEIKAANGELHTLRCKRCGTSSPDAR